MDPDPGCDPLRWLVLPSPPMATLLLGRSDSTAVATEFVSGAGGPSGSQNGGSVFVNSTPGRCF